MAVQISTNVEFLQVNTTTNAGFILLPSTTTLAGRLLTIKDTTGTFGLRPLTLSTIGNDRFEEGTNLKRLIEPFGYITLASDGVNRWYTIDGTSMNTYTISTLTNPVSISTQSIFTSSATVSTLGFEDLISNTVSSFYTRSTLLFLGSNIIGGSKCGPTLFVPIRRPFVPGQISGNILWLDAADPNVFTGGSIWYDKSGTLNHAINGTPGLTRMPSLTTWTNGNNAAQFIFASANSAKTTNIIPAFNVSFFLVVRINTLVTPAAQQFIMINNTDGQRQIDTDSTGFPGRVRFTTNSPSGSPVMNANVGQSQGFLVTLTVPTTTSGTTFGYYNGAITASASQTPLYSPATANSQHYFGSANGASGYITADYGEILIYNTVLSQANQQQVEGYLAWKWGLVGNLPAAHPFKTAPP